MPQPDEPLPNILPALILRIVWGFRTELALASAIVGMGVGADHLVGEPWQIVVPAVAFLVGLALPWSRRWISRRILRSRVRRAWHRAVRELDIGPFHDVVPRITRIKEVPAGHRLNLRIPLGGCVDDLGAVNERIAVAMSVADVRVKRSALDASRAEVVVLRRDPLATPTALPWPVTNASSVTLWRPVPVGIDEDGGFVEVRLPEHNLLIGGEPGAGKSVALSLFAASAALDTSVKLWLLDGKLVELATWTSCSEHSVGASVMEAVDVLRHVQREMGERYEDLLARRQRKVQPGDGLPLHVVLCDELAMYLTDPDRKARSEFADVLRDLVARGRAAGVIVLAATQKPASDIVPTSLRDLFGFRWAMRCATREASDTILGSGWSTVGYSASDVDAGTRGVGYLLHEGGTPVRLRSYYLDDAELSSIAVRAEEQRRTPSADEEVR